MSRPTDTGGERSAPADRNVSALSELHRAINSMEIGYQVLDRELRYLFVNEAVCRQAGCRPGDLVGRGMTEAFPQLAGSPLVGVLEDVLASGEPRRMLNEFDAGDGNSGWFELAIDPVEDGIAIVSNDVTERVEAESDAGRLRTQLSRVDKLDAIGRLAGGVAHDFNNALQAILGYTEALAARPDLAEEARTDLDGIVRAAESAAGLSRQLLAVGRRQELKPKRFDMNERLRDLASMLGRLVGAGIAVDVRPGEGALPIEVDPHSFDHVVLNLAANARDAMPDGGRLILETGRVDVDDLYVDIHPEIAPGQFGVLTVTDSGEGMDVETQARIFEPFFSTKGDGGSGLGLAGAYGMVQQSGGHIWVYSEPGEGTVFKLHFPLAAGAAAAVAAPRGEPQRLGRGETILVVEDDDAIRALFERILVRAGYAVAAAEDGEAALRLVAQRSLVPALLLTDVVMPRLSGPRLFARLKERQPDLKAAFVSGYTARAAQLRDGEVGEAVFIEKPVTPTRLLEGVRCALSAASGGAGPA